MGGTKWTSERDAQLFLLLVNSIGKLDADGLAKAWKQTFPNETFIPTARAITEHVIALKKQAGGGSAAGTSKATPRAAVNKSTPAKRTSPFKTPTSKRTKNAGMSDEDDSEDERKLAMTPVPKREASARRSKNKSSYLELSDEESDADGLHSAQVDKSADFLTTTPNTAKRADSVTGRDSLGAKVSKVPKLDYFAAGANDSDDDDFTPYV